MSLDIDVFITSTFNSVSAHILVLLANGGRRCFSKVGGDVKRIVNCFSQLLEMDHLKEEECGLKILIASIGNLVNMALTSIHM